MAETRPIDLWFTMGSTYSDRRVMRLPALEKATGILEDAVSWYRDGAVRPVPAAR